MPIAHRPPPAAEPTWLPGEQIHAEITADAWRYLALDVPYDRRTILFGGPIGFLCSGLASMIGNRLSRHAAQALAAAQWRYLGHLPITVTNRRLVVEHGNARWPIWFEQVTSCDQRGDVVVLTFDGDAPYALGGPAVLPLMQAAGLSGGRP